MWEKSKTVDNAIQLADTLLALDKTDEVVSLLANLDGQLVTDATQALLAVALARQGKLEDAKQIAARTSGAAKGDPGALYLVARMHAMTGNSAQALAALTQCYEAVPPSRLESLKSLTQPVQRLRARSLRSRASPRSWRRCPRCPNRSAAVAAVAATAPCVAIVHMARANRGIDVTRTRRVVQGLFLVLVFVGVFGLQANCERWCPFGGVEAIYTYVAEGNMLCSLGVSNFFILGGVLVATLLVRRAFCGYMCPIGSLSEWLHSLGRRCGIPRLRVSSGWDRALSMLKYGVLVVVLVLTYRAGELIFRGFDPCYALLSRHGEDITYWAYVVSGAILVASLADQRAVLPLVLSAGRRPQSVLALWPYTHSSRCRALP